MIYYIFYILDGYELLKADAECLLKNKWGLRYEIFRIGLTEAECAENARSQGVKLFQFCNKKTSAFFHCFVYKKSKSVDTCSTSPNPNKCSVYRVKEGNDNIV